MGLNIKPNKKDMKSAVGQIAARNNGVSHAADILVDVKNLRVIRRENVVIADILFLEPDDNHTDRYDDQEFPLPEVEKIAGCIRAARIANK